MNLSSNTHSVIDLYSHSSVMPNLKISGTSSSTSTKHVQLIWTDYANITRCCGMLNEMFDSMKSTGRSLCAGIMSLPHSMDVPIEDHVGEVRSVPDLDTFVKVPWYSDNDNTYLCFSNVRKSNLELWDHCPRTFVKIQSDNLLRETGLAVQLGFELEFYIFDTKDGRPVPIDTTVVFELKSLRGKPWKILTEIVETLKLLGIPVWSYHSESGHGQFEIAIGPFNGDLIDTVRIGDSLVLARQAIYSIVNLHGLTATFIPKPLIDYGGSGCHMHISLVNKNPITSITGSTVTVLEQFIAGTFVHLPKLIPILAPTMNSYDRIIPGEWSGGYHCIGTENKEASIRLIRNTTTGTLERFEIKTPDNTSNPYLMIGSVIAAGLDGIRKRCKLPEEVNIDPSLVPEDRRPKKMPSTLEDALQLFEKSEFVKNTFGEKVHELVVRMRENEMKYWDSLADRESRLKFLMSRY